MENSDGTGCVSLTSTHTYVYIFIDELLVIGMTCIFGECERDRSKFYRELKKKLSGRLVFRQWKANNIDSKISVEEWLLGGESPGGYEHICGHMHGHVEHKCGFSIVFFHYSSRSMEILLIIQMCWFNLTIT